MDCCGVTAQLEAYLGDDLPEDQVAAIKAHLLTCLLCRQRLAQLTTEAELLSGVAPRQAAREWPGHSTFNRLEGMVPAVPLRSDAPSQVGPYHIERRLGSGGMGVVYEATDTRLGRRVALKMLLRGDAPIDLLDRLRREARLLAHLSHPNIVPVHEVGEHEGQPYLVLEYIAGGTLARWAQGRSLPPRLAAEITLALAGAIQSAHDRGIIHRDLKPANVLLRIADRGSRMENQADAPSDQSAIRNLQSAIPMITDFGLGRAVEETAGLTCSGQVLGTPGYMAPEQISGDNRAVGPAVDIYGLGAILYELVTGRPPFHADHPLVILLLARDTGPPDPRSLNATIPRPLETICLKCLAKEPHRRYPSALALADDLGRFLRGEPIRAKPVGPLERTGSGPADIPLSPSCPARWFWSLSWAWY